MPVLKASLLEKRIRRSDKNELLKQEKARILTLQTGQLDVKLSMRPDVMAVDVSMVGFSVFGCKGVLAKERGQSPVEEMFPMMVSVRKEDASKPSFMSMSVRVNSVDKEKEKKRSPYVSQRLFMGKSVNDTLLTPLKEKTPDIAIVLETEPIDVVYEAETISRIVPFFTLDAPVSLEAFLNAARDKLIKMKTTAQKSIYEALENQIDLDLHLKVHGTLSFRGLLHPWINFIT